jgi:hypothetical protein
MKTWPLTLLDATRHYSTLLDATRRYLTFLNATWRYLTLLNAIIYYSTLLNAARRFLDATWRYLTLLDAIRRYSTLLDATRRYSTLLDAFSTLLDVTRRYLTLLDATQRCSTLLNATRHCTFNYEATWLAFLAGRLGRHTWPVDLAGRLGRQTWPADLAGRLGQQTWPTDLLKLKMALRLKNNIVSFKKQIKNQGSSHWTARFKRDHRRQCRGTDLLSRVCLQNKIWGLGPLVWEEIETKQTGLNGLVKIQTRCFRSYYVDSPLAPLRSSWLRVFTEKISNFYPRAKL